MAEADPNLTPEKKLLKLIEEPEGAGAQAGEKPKAGFNIASLFSPSAIKGRLAFIKEKLISQVKDRQDPVNFRQINRFVILATIGFGVYLVAAVIYEVGTVYQNVEGTMGTSQKEIAEAPAVEGRKLDPNLFEDVQSRNIFLPLEKRTTIEAVDSQSDSLKLVDITKDLKLTGISIDPANPARSFCMVEDLKKNVTSFLKVGDSISGLRVDEITSNGVILKHQRDSIELR